MFFNIEGLLYRNPFKAVLDFILKAVWEFLKKRVMGMIWGWAIWAICIGFVVVVAVGLALWYFFGR